MQVSIVPVRARLLALLIAFFASAELFAQTPIRVATWNIQAVGAPGSAEYEAAVAVLVHLDADILGVNEVSSAGDVANLEALAADAGYGYVAAATSTPFGAQRNAVLSRFAFAEPVTEHDSSTLSGDPSANDITRRILEARVEVPGNALDLTVVSQHWKSGNGNDDELRRVIESIRMTQVLDHLQTQADAYVILGDTNEEFDSVPRTPNPFSSLPSGLPSSFKLGSDLEAQLLGSGIENNPFEPLVATSGAVVISALQLDGSDSTRPASGRRLDYLAVSAAIAAGGVAAEVYDSRDSALAGGLPKLGAAPAVSASLDASDHLPVFADFTIPAAGLAAIPTLSNQSLVLAGCLVFGLAFLAILHRRSATRPS